MSPVTDLFHIVITLFLYEKKKSASAILTLFFWDHWRCAFLCAALKEQNKIKNVWNKFCMTASSKLLKPHNT